MANYYSPTVFRQPVRLTDLIYRVLEVQGGNCFPTAEVETILDGIVKERPPMTEYTVAFEEGWSGGRGVEEYLEYIDADEVEKELGPEQFEEFKRLLDLESHQLLREILKADPDIEMIEVQCGFNCSKMRLDGYGGYALIVNRKGYLYINTGGYEIDEDGIIQSTAAFQFWEPEAVEAAE